jgi:hypothetical protein
MVRIANFEFRIANFGLRISDLSSCLAGLADARKDREQLAGKEFRISDCEFRIYLRALLVLPMLVKIASNSPEKNFEFRIANFGFTLGELCWFCQRW